MYLISLCAKGEQNETNLEERRDGTRCARTKRTGWDERWDYGSGRTWLPLHTTLAKPFGSWGLCASGCLKRTTLMLRLRRGAGGGLCSTNHAFSSSFIFPSFNPQACSSS